MWYKVLWLEFMLKNLIGVIPTRHFLTLFSEKLESRFFGKGANNLTVVSFGIADVLVLPRLLQFRGNVLIVFMLRESRRKVSG